MFSTGPSIENSIDINSEDYHLAHLDLRFTAVNEDVIPQINNTIVDTLGFSPEQISIGLISKTKLQYGSTWYSVNAISVDPNKTRSINQVELIEGTLTIGKNETVVLASFARHLNLTLGDTLSFDSADSTSESRNFTIVGFVEAINFLSYELTQEGAIYFSEEDFRDLLNFPPLHYNNVLIYFSEDISETELSQCSENLQEMFTENNITCYLQWQAREISFSAALTDALNLTSRYLATSAILIIIIVGIVIFIITKRYAFEQRKQTGMLYSYGFSSATIMKAFLLRTIIISTVSIIIGTIAGWFFLNLLTNMLANQWGIINVFVILSMNLVIEVVALTLVIALFFTYLAARENVSLTPYEAIRGKSKEYGKTKKLHDTLISVPYQIKMALRNISRSKTRSIFTVFAFCGSIILSFSLISAQSNIEHTQTQYYEKIDWDIKAIFKTNDYTSTIYNDMKTHPSLELSEPYLETYVQFSGRYDMFSALHGVISNSTLIEIDLQEGLGFTNESAHEVIMAQYNADHFGFSIGDEISFWLLGTQINVTIVGLCRDMEMPISMFIQLETLESDLGFLPMNGMLASAKEDYVSQLTDEMNEDPQIQFAIMKSTLEQRIGRMISSQTKIVQIMVVLGLIVSFLSIFSTTLIILIERGREIALQRVFGFSTFQILEQLFSEMILLSLIALGFGYIGGNFLSRYWTNLVSSTFFAIDSFFIWEKYLILFGFTVLTVCLSLVPELKTLQTQGLAEGIQEE
ncbi:MAG: ABC transporter permease [Promethearchaeota archaeon]|nr:MAG: ABC transporter permease [Candidatus Lokiarchaeota archaeon]